MAITATAGGVSAAIEPRRPSWADMNKHYPAKGIDTKTLYNSMIKGAFIGGDTKHWLANTCAVRMSYALLRSGFHLSRTQDHQASKLGGDKKWYWLRVANLREELHSRFKGFDAELNLPMIKDELVDDANALEMGFSVRKDKAEQFIKDSLANRNGIIVFDVVGWENATGHFTLWDGTTMRIAFGTDHDDPADASYYMWLTSVLVNEETRARSLLQVSNIHFWELK